MKADGATMPLSAWRGEADRQLCEALFEELRAATGDGVGITRESFGPANPSRSISLNAWRGVSDWRPSAMPAPI